MNKATINRAIKHLGIEIQNKRGGGYSYFTSLETGDQVGESVSVCYMNQQTLEQWIANAENAVAEQADYNSKRLEPSPNIRIITKK